jgi:hypothetical protein
VKWRILDGPHQVENTLGVDGAVWDAIIENVNDPAQRRHIRAVISGTALDTDPDRLITDIRAAIESNGKTAIERFLDEQVPPDRIIVSSTGILPSDD